MQFSGDDIPTKLAKLEHCIAEVRNWCNAHVTYGQRDVVVDAYVVGGTAWEFINRLSERAEARYVFRWARQQPKFRLKYYDVSVNMEADDTSVAIVMAGHDVWAMRGH